MFSRGGGDCLRRNLLLFSGFLPESTSLIFRSLQRRRCSCTQVLVCQTAIQSQKLVRWCQPAAEVEDLHHGTMLPFLKGKAMPMEDFMR